VGDAASGESKRRPKILANERASESGMAARVMALLVAGWVSTDCRLGVGQLGGLWLAVGRGRTVAITAVAGSEKQNRAGAALNPKP